MSAWWLRTCLKSEWVLVVSVWFAPGLATGRAAPHELDDEVKVWSAKDGLPHNSVQWLAQTSDRFLWAGTAQGLARFDGAQFKTFEPSGTPALGDAKVKSLCMDPSGALWVLGENGSITRRDRSGWFAMAEADGRPAAGAHGIYSDGARLLVVSDAEGRVFRLEGGRLAPWLDTRQASPGRFIGINVDFDGTVWVRHDNTLDWWDGQRWRRVVAPDGSTNFVALKTGPSHAGGMWVSSPSGLRRLRRGVWDERILAYVTPKASLQAILEDRSGNVWVAPGGGHLLRFDGEGRLTELPVEPALAEAAIKNIFEDGEGHLWLATDRGLMRMRVAQRQDSGRLPDAPPPPNAVLEEVLVDDRVLATSGSATGPGSYDIPVGARTVEFRFTGVSFDAPERLRFRSRLEGVDAEWKEGTRRVAVYTNLPSGRHFFRLMAGLDGAAWDGRETTAGVMVPPRMWQTWWFRATAAGLVIMVAAWIGRRRVEGRRRLQAQQDQFYRQLIESQEAERQRIARELHDSLGQNLLLIRNRAVMGLKDNASPERMREQLREISDASAGSIEEIRTIARALRPYQLDRLGLTKTLQDVASSVTSGGGLRIEAEVEAIDGLFPADAEIGLFRLVQEALNNVLKHADAECARLSVQHADGAVAIEVVDDGRGFDATQQDGFGLNGMRERVRLLGGTLEMQSVPGEGTRLRIMIPVPAPPGRNPAV